MDEFTVAEDLTTYSVEDIDNLITQGNARLDELLALDAPTLAQVEEAEKISAAVTGLEAEKASRASAVERMAALKNARVTASDESESEQGTESEGEDGAQEEAEEDGGDSADATAEAPTEPEKEKKAVTASTTPAKPKSRPVVPDSAPTQRMTITAAAEVPAFANGQEIPDAAALTTAFLNRTRSFRPLAAPGNGSEERQQHYGLAVMQKPFEDRLIADETKRSDQDVLDYAGDEKRLPGRSLVAAGGWCAPSEVLMDFCGGESTDGLWNVPEMQIRRGGVKTTPGPDFATLYSSSGFSQTEAQAIAGTSKGCYEVPCPTFTDNRLDAVGLCIKSPILQNAAWPELTQRTIQLALVAMQHRVSGALLTKALTAATAQVAPNAVGGTASDSLNSLELMAETTRQNYRLPLAQSMEVVVPFWVRSAIRADLAERNGVDFLAVSDAQIDEYFRVRKLNVQYVYNFGTALVSNGGTTASGYPANYTALIYPSGTFVKGTSNVINLNAVYDAASLDINMYTALFMEEGVLLLTRCFTPRKVTIPLAQAGKTGAASNTVTFTAA